MTVQRLLSEITSAELTEWIAFYDLEPWGSEIEDLRAGTIASMIANVNRDAAKRPEAFGPLDFIPWAHRADAANDASAPLLLADSKAQTNAILAACFGIARNG